jgi:hypothetical protein
MLLADGDCSSRPIPPHCAELSTESASVAGYGEPLFVAFDLHRFEMLRALHYPLSTDIEEEVDYNEQPSDPVRPCSGRNMRRRAEQITGPPTERHNLREGDQHRAELLIHGQDAPVSDWPPSGGWTFLPGQNAFEGASIGLESTAARVDRRRSSYFHLRPTNRFLRNRQELWISAPG